MDLGHYPGAGVEVSAPFTGDFMLLPVVAHLEQGPVPMRPTREDFDVAVSGVGGADPFTMAGAAHHWRIEAIRQRLQAPGCVFSAPVLAEIADRTAARLYAAQRDHQAKVTS